MKLEFGGKIEPPRLEFWLLWWTSTQVLKTRVPKKKVNKDDDEHEELEMGRRSRGTRSKNLFGERRSNEEESRAEGKKNRGRRSSTGKTRVPRGFFFTSVSTACNSSFKNSIFILEFKFLTLNMLVCWIILQTRQLTKIL